MKKKIILGMGLTAMMAACSSEDVLTNVQNSQDLDKFAGIEKVEATFNMGVKSRLASQWNLEEGDRVGLAWLTDDNEKLDLTGEAYQNHPLYTTAALNLQPQTSIYVGEYFVYAPYDESVVNIDKINFAIPQADLLSTWNGLAKSAIYISPKWTTVSKTGEGVEGPAGINKEFEIHARKFSNSVALEFDYDNHVIDLKDETNDNKAYASDAEIFDAEVLYVTSEEAVVSINKFQYAPTEEAIGDDLWYAENPLRDWETFKLGENLTVEAATPASATTVEEQQLNAVVVDNHVPGGYKLVPSKRYVADRTLEGDKFYMNALPAMAEVGEGTEIRIVINTTYGKITVQKPVSEIAKTAYESGYKDYFDGVTVNPVTNENLTDEESTAYTESFVQVLGKNGKFETAVDFSTAVMNEMHVKNDAHLIQLLRYYRDYKLGTEYEEEKVNLYLDADSEGEFKISKTSIALMQSINGASTNKIALNVCDDHGAPKIVVTNNAKEGKEVPSFQAVFGHNLNVYLEAQDWTWNGTTKKNTGRVQTIYNRGTLTVGSANVEAGNLGIFSGLVNLEGAAVDFTEDVATLWKVNLTNHGIITIPATAHMRVYSDVINDVTEITGVRTGKMGLIVNDGVFGVVEEMKGTITNYGKIKHNEGAKTFITTNAAGENFADNLSETHKIGIIEMAQPDANVSVSNSSDKGIIAYVWPKDQTVYVSPEVVRYNYLIVEDNIQFTEIESEIRYIEVKGADVYVTNKGGYLKNLQGVIVDKNYQLNITEGNKLRPARAAYVKGYVYNGGEFTYNSDVTTYFGGDDADKENILKWTGL